MGETEKSLLYLNEPIVETEKDIIGVATYVDKLDTAIDLGAQMIAVTSPFGAGKSTIIKLLEKKRAPNKKYEKIVKISMWSLLHGDNETSHTIDLHRLFLYQLISQISPKRETYISRRLSPNFGLIKLHINQNKYWFPLIISLFALCMSWVLNSYPELVCHLIPVLANNIDFWKVLSGALGAVFAIYIVTRAEIIYSASHKADVKREIEFSEIVDLYRSEILKYSNCVWANRICIARWAQYILRRHKKYIIVIEDLDRTEDASAVENFLKEIRKYYLLEIGDDNRYRNKVVFIANVKPETIIRKVCTAQGKAMTNGQKETATEDLTKESLYAKLFDYVLSLQTINVDNFDSFLEGLLSEKKPELAALGLITNGELSDIPGMKWIIREPGLGIRQIKNRLNTAFSLYESLKEKFNTAPITFEKCAVAAYLTTAFESDFYNTSDRAFQELVNLHLKHESNNAVWAESLPYTSEKYIEVVRELVEAKLIDAGYRTYFYNCPKGSYLYNSDELQVIDAILYSENIDNLEQVVQRVVSASSLAPSRAFHTLSQLGLPLPSTVFSSESLYVEALKHADNMVIQFISNLNYSEDSLSKTIAFIKKIVSYDKERLLFDSNYANKISECIETRCNEGVLLKIRAMFACEFSHEILWYKNLFSGVHPLIKISEMETLSLIDSIDLINTENDHFSIDITIYILRRFMDLACEEAQNAEKHMEDLLRISGNRFAVEAMVPLYLKFMNSVSRIIPDFETAVMAQLDKKETTSIDNDEIFSDYQTLINNTSTTLTMQTIKNICSINIYCGYVSEVAEKLKEANRILEYVLVLLCNREYIPFGDKNVAVALENNIEWLIDNISYFSDLRELISTLPWSILQSYSFMFTSDAPIMTEKELENIRGNDKEPETIVMMLIPAELVVESNITMLCNVFNSRIQRKDRTLSILLYVARFSTDVAHKCFYSLDFDCVKYRSIPNKAKLEVNSVFNEHLKLDQPKEKLNFMYITKFLNASWEEELLDKMKEDNSLEDTYIAAVNNCDKLSIKTISVLCQLPYYHAMSSIVNQSLYKENHFDMFVCSLILGKSRFDMGTEEEMQTLWPTYIKIFSSSSMSDIRKYMAKNKDFLRFLMREKVYVGLPEENRFYFSSIFQDKECLLDVMEYGDDFALRYFLSIDGFSDESAATVFVDIVLNNTTLKANNELYEHTHQMLISPSLKWRYTYYRKKSN